jgi:hypothetical protein
VLSTLLQWARTTEPTSGRSTHTGIVHAPSIPAVYPCFTVATQGSNGVSYRGGYAHTAHAVFDVVLSQPAFREEYVRMKHKYGKRWVDSWPEETDPAKYVYEELAIASWLLAVWRYTPPLRYGLFTPGLRWQTRGQTAYLTGVGVEGGAAAPRQQQAPAVRGEGTFTPWVPRQNMPFAPELQWQSRVKWRISQGNVRGRTLAAATVRPMLCSPACQYHPSDVGPRATEVGWSGFLTYLLIAEGHTGWGVDRARRKIWDVYPQACDPPATPSIPSVYP